MRLYTAAASQAQPSMSGTNTRREMRKTLPSRLPFHELDNVILTPHTSGLTEGTMSYRWKAIAENLRRLVHGETLLNVVWTQPRNP